ncbi:MAG: type II toxin-antitoxin system VapC family toxin [Pseudomonadota bacterium]
MKKFSLDSSAFIAYIFDEKGADEAYKYLYNSVVSSVIYCEFISLMMERGFNIDEARETVDSFGIEIIDFDETQAVLAAELRNKTKVKGLSLGDRACLALAITKKIPVVTADKIWSKLDIGVNVKLIR